MRGEYQPNYMNPTDPANQLFNGPAYRGSGFKANYIWPSKRRERQESYEDPEIYNLQMLTLDVLSNTPDNDNLVSYVTTFIMIQVKKFLENSL